MRFKVKTHSVDSLFSFLLLLIFCLFALLLAGMGSAVYRNGTEHLNENYTSRTAIAYLSEKVRQHDRAGDIFLTAVGDGDGADNNDAASTTAEADSDGAASTTADADSDGAASTTADADSDGAASTTADGYPAIGFRDMVDGASFITYVYFYQGALCELFVRDGTDPLAAMGSRIVELDSFEFGSMDPQGMDLPDYGDPHTQNADPQEPDRIDLLTATAVSQDGNSLSVLIPIRSR